jgi:hypothetical protein
MGKAMSDKEVQAQINALYEANFSHVDFMDNMGGECECAIHKELINLCLSIGFDPREGN